MKSISKRIREIKVRHGLKPEIEIKWTKVSPAKVHFYLDVLDYFFDDDDLHFRALIVPDKSKINHIAYRQTHDDQDPGVKVWDYEEGSGKIRTYLWLESLDYVVILEKQRKGKKREAAFLVTTFHLDGESTRRSMRRKYERRYR